jgi:hypothetical protein
VGTGFCKTERHKSSWALPIASGIAMKCLMPRMFIFGLGYSAGFFARSLIALG